MTDFEFYTDGMGPVRLMACSDAAVDLLDGSDQIWLEGPGHASQVCADLIETGFTCAVNGKAVTLHDDGALTIAAPIAA